jgi:D-alanyl-lipoteichoic acid acyltransferase DltB (MBOAT superfamily)
MPLNSWQFILLSAVAIVMVPALSGGVRTALFLVVNIAFVWSYWGAEATPLAAAFILLGYLCARFGSKRGPWAMAIGVTVLTLLFVYLRGYSVAGSPQPRPGIGLLSIAGLSFLFFKVAHVVVDASSGTIKDLSFSRYLNYCLNFTTVLMGPIQRFQDFTGQWESRSTASSLGLETAIDAANRILRGLVKAFVLAPLVAPYMLTSGLPLETLPASELLLRTYAFYVFLYLDFSGYCDLMIGIGILMGIRPPENFNFPFLARNVSAYWLRVHRSLTQWLTDYVFTPTYRFGLGIRSLAAHPFLVLAGSLILTMLVAGVWHGTTLGFVAFGAVHGMALVVMRGYEQVMTGWLGRARFKQFEAHPGVAVAAVFLTYNFTSLAYVFFVLDIHESFRVFARLAATATELLT